MISIRSFFTSRNTVKLVQRNFFQRGISTCNTTMRQESATTSIETKTENEESFFPKQQVEFFPFRDSEISSMKTMEELQKFILKKKNFLTLTQIITILQQMHFFFYKENWSRDKIKSLKESIEFHVLLGNFKKCLHKVDKNDLVTFLTFFAKLDVPYTSQLIQDIIQHLSGNVDQITFTKSAMLYTYLIKQKANKQLQLEVKYRIENYIKTNLESASDNEVAKAVYYANSCDFSLECVLKILNIILIDGRPIWTENEILGNTLRLLTKVKDHEKFPELEKQFYEILDDLKRGQISVSNFCHNFCHFIYVYGHQVLFDKIEYNEDFVNGIIDVLMDEKVFTTNKLLCLEGMIAMKHIRHDLVKKTISSVLFEPQYVNKNANYFAVFVRALGESNYFSLKLDLLEPVKKYLEELEIYKNNKEMRRLGFDKKFSAAVDLISIGVYPRIFLDNLSKEIETKSNFSNFSEYHGGKLKVALLINEALSVFRTPYKKSFLTESTFCNIMNILSSSKTTMFDGREKWLSEIKENLESFINQKNCILQNCRTRYGQEIHFAIAVNKHGEVFNFQPTDDRIKIIENLELPPGYRLVLVHFVPKTGYNRNIGTVGSYYSLKLKILNAMKYRTLTILNEEWTNLPENERANYFWGRVKNEKTDLVLINAKKFIGNDEVIVKKDKKKVEKENNEEKPIENNEEKSVENNEEKSVENNEEKSIENIEEKSIENKN